MTEKEINALFVKEYTEANGLSGNVEKP